MKNLILLLVALIALRSTDACSQSSADRLVVKQIAEKVSEQLVLDNNILYTYSCRLQKIDEYINEEKANIVIDERLALDNVLWCKVEREEGTMKILTAAGVKLSDIIVMKESPCFRKQNQGLVIERGVIINCPDKMIKDGVIVDKPAKTYNNNE